MSNNKQSSVEWLQAIELERDLTLADWNKAKAMHKEDIKNAYCEGWEEQIRGRYMPTEYYNKTFTND